AAIVFDAVLSRQEAYDLHRLERRRPRIDRIGTDVADHLRAQRQDMARVVEAELGIDDLIEALAVAGKILDAVAGPLDRAGELPRDGAHKNLLRVEGAFPSEAAADIRANHPDLVAGHFERSR